ncbi:MAG: RidA family protein [Oscillospiraceae bacterium]
MAERKEDIIRSGGNGRRSTTVCYGGLCYVSGITSVVLEGDMRTQAQDVFNQIDRLLASVGTDKTRVLRASCILNTMEEYPDFNAVWDTWVVDGHEPARSMTAADLTLSEYRLAVSVIAAL